MPEPWPKPKKKRTPGFEVFEDEMPLTDFRLWRKQPPPDPMDVSEPFEDVVLPDGRVIRADRPTEGSLSIGKVLEVPWQQGVAPVIGAGQLGLAKLLGNETILDRYKRIVEEHPAWRFGPTAGELAKQTLATDMPKWAPWAPGTFKVGRVDVTPGLDTGQMARAFSDPLNVIGVGSPVVGRAAKDVALGMAATAQQAKQAARPVGEALQDIAAQGKPTLRPRLGITPGELPVPKEPWQMTKAEFESQVTSDSLYHVTKPENLKAITNKGLLAKRSKKVSANQRLDEPAVYAFDTVTQARDFAYDNNMMDNHVVIKLNTKDYLVVPDPEYAGNNLGIRSFGIKGNVKASDVMDVTQYHEAQVKQALSEGKPVPPEVLKGYPDLVAAPMPASVPEALAKLTPEASTIPPGQTAGAAIPPAAPPVQAAAQGTAADIARIVNASPGEVWSTRKLAGLVGMEHNSQAFRDIMTEGVNSGQFLPSGSRSSAGKSALYWDSTQHKAVVGSGPDRNPFNIVTPVRAGTESAAAKGAVGPTVPAGQARASPPNVPPVGTSVAAGVPPAPPSVAGQGRFWLPEPPRTGSYLAYAKKEVAGSFRKKTGALETVEEAHQQVLKARDLGENAINFAESYVRTPGNLTKAFGLLPDGMVTLVANPENRSLAINDVLSNPTHYRLTPVQQEIAKRHGFVYKEALKLAKSYGVEIGEIGGPDEFWQYIARKVTSKVDPVTGQVIAPIPTPGGFRMGAKISAQKERVFDEMLQGVDEGYIYAHPEQALAQHIKGIYRLIGNKQAQNTVANLTRQVTEQTPIAFGERYLNQPAMRQRAATVEIANAIDKIFTPEQAWKPLRVGADVSGAMVGQVAALDVSAPFIQGLPVLGHDLKQALKGKPSFAWAQAYGKMWQAVKNPANIDAFREANQAVYKRAMESGVIVAQSEMTAGTPLVGRALGKIPKVGGTLQEAHRQTWGRLGTSFSTFLEVSRIKLFEQMEGPWLRAGGNQYDLGAVINRMTGSISSAARGVGANQRLLERTAAFAPNYLRASLLLMKDMMGRGVKAREAQSSIAAMLGAGVAVYYAIEKLREKEPKIRPWPKRLGGDGAEAFTFDIAGNRVGLGSWFYGMIKTVAEIGAVGVDDPSALVVWDKNHPLSRFLHSKTGPAVQLAWELGTGRNFWGKEFTSPKDYLLRVVESVMPLSASSLIEPQTAPAVEQSLATKAVPLVASQMGARVFPYTFKSQWTDQGAFTAYNAIPSNDIERLGKLKAAKTPAERQQYALSRDVYRIKNPQADAQLFITGQVTSVKTLDAARIARQLILDNKIDPETIKGIEAKRAEMEKRAKLGVRDTTTDFTEQLIQSFGGASNQPAPSPGAQSPRQLGEAIIASPEYQQLTYEQRQQIIRELVRVR